MLTVVLVSQAGSCFYCGLDGESCASMGYLAKPHPAWTTAPVRENVDESRKKGFKTPFQVTDVPGNRGSCPLLQTSLPPSTPSCQAETGRGLGSGAGPSFFHKDILVHLFKSLYIVVLIFL